jgi:2-hydroxymuconate-semialdehyde hydrolase
MIAPDLLGFGFTERPTGIQYTMESWLAHVVGLIDALELEEIGLVGNSFGSSLGLNLAVQYPRRVRRMVLMGSMGVQFPITQGLEQTWGYTPSFDNMRSLLDLFAYDRSLVSSELAELRYQASIRPGFQEAFAAMFPPPRQRWIDALSVEEGSLRDLSHEVLIVQGREDRVIPLQTAYLLLELLGHSQLHVFGRCGHWTQIEHNRRFNKLLGDFFAEAIVC